MLQDALLRRRYLLRLERLLRFLDVEQTRYRHDVEMNALIDFYADRLTTTRDQFQARYRGDVVSAFVSAESAGVVELITTSATHSYLPMFEPGYQRAQLRLGLATFAQHVGHRPDGVWLPECGYSPGIDDLLADEGAKYFFVESHAIDFAKPRAVFGTWAPVACPRGVAAFPRDRRINVAGVERRARLSRRRTIS